MSNRFHPYSRFAALYDTMGGDRFSTRMVDYTLRLLKRFRFRPKDVLDICCGTGTAAVLFAEQGYTVTGLDGSADMLRVARRKARQKKLAIRFIHQRLPEFAVADRSGRRLQTFDLVTSFYDSLNYLLTEDDLGYCFMHVSAHLRPGGLFIFDMNGQRALKLLWGAGVFAGCHSKMAWIWQSLYYQRARQADLRATFFVKKGKLWEMFEEIHSEKAYPNSTIKRLLVRAGFEILAFYDCGKFHKPNSKTYRIAVVARKKQPRAV